MDDQEAGSGEMKSTENGADSDADEGQCWGKTKQSHIVISLMTLQTAAGKLHVLGGEFWETWCAYLGNHSIYSVLASPQKMGGQPRLHSINIH